MSDEISWGWLGAEPMNRLVLDGTFRGHNAHADIQFSGEDIDLEWFGDDFGWNPFKKISRGIKNLTHNPVKFVRRGAQNVAHTATTAGRTIAYASKVARPWVQRGAVGLSILFPPAAPIAAGVAAAVTACAAADGRIPKVGAAKHAKPTPKQAKARAIIVNTAKEAKKGKPEAKRAMAIIKHVRKTRENAVKRGHNRAWTVTKKGFMLRVL